MRVSLNASFVLVLTLLTVVIHRYTGSHYGVASSGRGSRLRSCHQALLRVSPRCLLRVSWLTAPTASGLMYYFLMFGKLDSRLLMGRVLNSVHSLPRSRSSGLLLQRRHSSLRSVSLLPFRPQNIHETLPLQLTVFHRYESHALFPNDPSPSLVFLLKRTSSPFTLVDRPGYHDHYGEHNRLR